EHNRRLIAALERSFDEAGIALPIYFGNLHAEPFVESTAEAMQRDGVSRALVFATSLFGSASACRKYGEALARAEAASDGALRLSKLRLAFNHPGFVEAMASHVLEAFDSLAASDASAAPRLVFTAHSIPRAMAAASPYVAQLEEACRLVA